MDRFWNKVQKLPGVNTCWLWTAGKDRYGYGQFKLDGKVVRAHQVSWKIKKRVNPSYLCHTCDNRACVNPAHLYEGSHASNMSDKKHRNLTWSKYDPHVIRRIRRKYAVGFSSGQLSKEFNIPRSTVLNILDGKLCRSTGGPIRDPNFRYYGNRFKKAIPRKS